MSAVSQLNDILMRYSHTQDMTERQSLEAQLWQRYGVQGAVWVLDMSGFSLTTKSRGIVYYLSLVRRMQLIVAPIIAEQQGQVVKFEADNCFARFAHVDHALAAAIAVKAAIAEANQATPQDLDIEISCGIDYGDYLLLGDHDFYGLPVNHASKLGEDLAESAEILLTQEAYAAITTPQNFAFDRAAFRISGVELNAYRLLG